ncbi:hypothetical protein PVAP13_6KG266606 [Panicum virgatum]|uniref:Uncharacterized protein n=1 Tax=Panicum virgatum TaxID=38727 RepID=A0A8T0RGV4_PANVG|nr:hypothetical protein PVAP13_6KG266606 [Panicum virgatum]
MEIVTNAMTLHALEQVPFQGTKFLSLRLIQKLLQNTNRRQLRSSASERLPMKWLDQQLTALWLLAQMFRDLFLNRSKECMVPDMTSA